MGETWEDSGVRGFPSYLTRSAALHDSPSCNREGSLDECGRPCDTPSFLLFSALWLRCNQSILVQDTQSAKDPDLTCFATLPFNAVRWLPVGPMSLDCHLDPFAISDSARPSLPEVPSGEQQFGALEVYTRSRWRQDALQAQPQIIQRTKKVGWMWPIAFRRHAIYYLEHQGACWICSLQTKKQRVQTQISQKTLTPTTFCLEEVHGKEEHLQAIQVFASKFQFFGTFIPDNENAGESAINIHKDLLPEGAIVSHVINCQGRDHLVRIQSARHNLVIDATLLLLTSILNLNLPCGNCAADCVLFTRPGLLVPVVWGLFWVISTSVIQKKDDLMSGTSHSPMATRERLLCSSLSFLPHVLEVGQSDCMRRDSTAFGVIRTLSRTDRIFINLHMAEARDFHYYSHVFENLVKEDIPNDHAAVRLVIPLPWMSKHLIFALSCSSFMKTTDSLRTRFVWWLNLVLLHKAKEITTRELLKQTPYCIGARIIITSTALRAFEIDILEPSCDVVKLGNLTALTHFPSNVLISNDLAIFFQSYSWKSWNMWSWGLFPSLDANRKRHCFG